MSITKADYDAFRSSPEADLYLSGSPLVSGVSATKSRDPVAEFKKGIKRDASLFTVLKDEKQWFNWRHSTVAMARSQGVEEVCDPAFDSSTLSAEEQALFIEKQKFMYSVFERTLQTDQGKSLVRDHEYNFDAQRVFRDIAAHAERSTKSNLESSALLAYITSARIADGTWKGNACNFILHWLEQNCQFEQQTEKNDHLSKGQKKTLLKSAVHDLEELRAVTMQANQFKTQTGKDLSFEEYLALLQSAAASYDAQFKVTSKIGNSKPARRTVYSMELANAKFESCDDLIDGESYDIDASIDTIYAHATQRRNRLRTPVEAQVPSDRWTQMSIEGKCA